MEFLTNIEMFGKRNFSFRCIGVLCPEVCIECGIKMEKTYLIQAG